MIQLPLPGQRHSPRDERLAAGCGVKEWSAGIFASSAGSQWRWDKDRRAWNCDWAHKAEIGSRRIKAHPPGCQSVQVRCLSFAAWIAVHIRIQVICHDEQNIRPSGTKGTFHLRETSAL